MASVVISFLLPASAGAAASLVRDRVFGGADEIDWSPGEWKQEPHPHPACATFPGGTNTGPEQPAAADSVVCGVLANAWSWTVTVPGGYSIAWGVHDLPPGIEICAPIFYIVGLSGVLSVEVDVSDDWMIVRDDQEAVLYEGSFSGFYPLRVSGVVLMEARRCGLVRILPEGACCYPDGGCLFVAEALCPTGEWRSGVPCDPNPCPPPPPSGACCFLDGSCQVLAESECAAAENQWQGPGTDCDPNPCPPPVPVETQSWGQIKTRYR